MPGFFPTPYPDELIYSLCARYSDCVQYRSKSAVNLELFGTAHCAAGLNFPHNLAHLAANLPRNNYYTADRLIADHTLFPFYSPFIPKGRVKIFREGMKASNRRAFYCYSGISASSITPYEYLRYCPQCAEEDKREFGQRYWHRLHQVFGVIICPKHNILIQESNIGVSGMAKHGGYASAERAFTPLPSVTRLFLDTNYNILINIARDVDWLLSQRGLSLEYESLYTRYLGLLIDKGLTDRTGRPRCQLLSNLLVEFFGSGLLKLLCCEVDVGKFSEWPLRILTDLLRGKAHHPLRYLLLIHFFGDTAESFFTRCFKDTQKRVRNFLYPFGSGPWPCLNPACAHFRQNVIKKCRVSNQKYAAIRNNRDRCVVASFSCTCGFTYCRRELDLPTLGKFQYSFIRVYGPVWETSLSKLWRDTSVSLEQMAKALGISPRTIKNQALRIGLTFPRRGPRSGITNCDPKSLLQFKKKTSKFNSLRKHYRREWLSIIKAHCKITQRFLRKIKLYKFFLWLRKHDRAWLNKHMSQPNKRPNDTRKIDWNARDIQVSEEVTQTLSKIKSGCGCRVRITKQSIMRSINKEKLVGSLGRLPLTAKKISEAVETREEYAIRRLNWAVGCLLKEQHPPTRHALRRLGGMDDFWHLPSKKSFFDRVLEELLDTYVTKKVA